MITTALSPVAKVRQVEPRSERFDLGNGLIMRWSTADDKDAIADCLATAFQYEIMGRNIPEGELPKKNEYLTTIVKRLLSGHHPMMSEYDFALVEDTTVLHPAKPGQSPRPIVVAATCLLQIAGFHGSVEMAWGMPEVVGTRSEYRNRGLVRRLFLDMIHPAAEARGDLLLLFPGIPYFYKQFGYENAVPLKSGRLLKNVASLYPSRSSTDSSSDKKSHFTLREATSDDISYLVRLSKPDRLFSKAEFGNPYDETFWRFVVEDITRQNTRSHQGAHHHAAIVVDSKISKDVGISLTAQFGGWDWKILSLDQDDGTGSLTYREVMTSLLSQMKAFDRPYYEAYCTKLNNNTLPEESDTTLRARGDWPALNFSHLSVNMTPTHPVTLLLESCGQLEPVAAKEPYRLYTRIPSLPKYLLKIAPVLEQRVKASGVWRDVDARLQVDFYQKVEGMSGRGLEIVLKKGQVVEVTDWKPKGSEQMAREKCERFLARKIKDDGEEELLLSAAFRPLSFTRLVTGALSVDELLKREMENIVGQGEARLLLEVLFPKTEEHHLDVMWL
ncbi:hypothetical protein BGX33_005257 [Mortierella sp. NVP41]|nr:hypothetical protein BGX33_005257 [Mortierella sp. NVP41]